MHTAVSGECHFNVNASSSIDLFFVSEPADFDGEQILRQESDVDHVEACTGKKVWIEVAEVVRQKRDVLYTFISCQMFGSANAALISFDAHELDMRMYPRQIEQPITSATGNMEGAVCLCAFHALWNEALHFITEPSLQ